ncbi:MAG: pyridoxamine 5'-phosphate oxidase [Bdellovibrionaceae bacterium]|nr:pyridoxamine 5'-phosphate oxidase [Pseudobdellovibrionaceae bacterium]
MSTFDFINNQPLKNFEIILKEAETKGLPEFNAMNLATVDGRQRPSVRVVLFKGLVDGALTFYTNYQGKKAKDLEFNSYASANFFWPQLERQVRVEGQVEKMSRELSEKYFQSRPRISQIGAWASNQSEKIESFEVIQNKIQVLEEKYAGKEVPCPPHWGGYLLRPNTIEFWFGREGRLHERYVYELVNGKWSHFLRSP